MSLWRVMFLTEHYGRMTLTINEVATQIGIAAGTIAARCCAIVCPPSGSRDSCDMRAARVVIRLRCAAGSQR